MNYADDEARSERLAMQLDDGPELSDVLDQWVNCPRGHTSPWTADECRKCGWVL